jgi:hypothetical protein
MTRMSREIERLSAMPPLLRIVDRMTVEVFEQSAYQGPSESRRAEER